MAKRLNKIAGYRAMLNLKTKHFAEMFEISIPAYRLKEKGEVPFKDNEKIILVKFFKDNGIDTNIEDLFF